MACLTVQARRNLSKGLRAYFADPENRARHKARCNSPATLRARSRARKRLWENPVWAAKERRRLVVWAKSRHRRKRISELMMGHTVSIATREKLSRYWIQFYKDHPELKKKVAIRQANWFKDHPRKGKKIIQNLINGVCNRPNDDELAIWGILQKYFPWQFVLNCSDKGKHIWVGRKIPDFVCAGKKLAVEFFGNHWHSKERVGRDKRQEERFYRRHYSKHGYTVVMFWTDDLRHTGSVVERYVVSKIQAALAAGG